MNNTLKQLKRITKLKRLTKSFLLTGLLLLIGVTAKAADYVFTYNGGYLAVDNSGNIVYATSFSPQCVWTCVSNTNTLAGAELNTTSRFLYTTVGSTKYWLVGSTTDGNAITTTTTAPGTARWRNNNNHLYYRDGSDCYAYYRENLWRTSRRNNGNNYGDNAYMSGNNTGTDYRSTTAQVTTSSGSSTSTAPVITNGADVLTSTGNSNYTASAAAYQIGYTNYLFSSTNHYFDANGNSFTGTPAAASISYSWDLTPNDYASVSGTTTTGVVNVATLPQSDVTLTLTITATATGGTPAAPANTTLTGTKTITIQGTKPSAPTISLSGTSVTLSTTATGTTTIRYTLDGTNPTATTGTVYSGPIDLSNSATSPVTIKAITVRNGNASDVTTETVKLTLPAPTITVNGSAGTATISATSGATIYYTIDGSTPTTSSTQYTESLTGLSLMTTIKAIALKAGWNNSSVASATVTIPSGVSGGVVTLFDLEDHSWSYYSDGSTPSQLHSLSPADVKITYYGDGIMMTGSTDYTDESTDYITSTHTDYKVGAKVNVGGENENTFVYYKTLERGDATDAAWTFSDTNQSSAASRCPYTPIPNPFQVRPRYGDRTVNGTTIDANDFTGWRGFQCWRLKSVTGGAVYSAASGNNALAVGAVINAETEIYFAPNAEYGMEVELEAVWARAYVKKADQANENPVGTNNVGYERNFCVPTTGAGYTLYTGTGKRITNDNHIPVTISCYYPDGTAPDNTANSISNTAFALTADTKFENIPINLTSNTLTLANYDIIVGRGCGSSTINRLQGINGNATDLDYTIRVESGTFNTLTFVRDGGSTVSGRYLIKAIMGSDYDRATGTNNKLSVSANSHLFFSRSAGFSGSSNKDQKTFDCVFKSGTYQSDQWDDDQNGTQGYLHIAYLGQNGAGTTYPGVRCVTVEGGELGGMCGGRGVNDGSNNSTYMTPEVITFDVRIKGGTFHGGVFGGAADNPSIGSRRFIMTGGTILGWLAGGCNGTGSQGGQGVTNGNSYIYVGGTALVGGNNAMSIQNTNGGQVFGAGRGHIENGTHRQSSVNYSYVAIADEAVISNDNNGGGNVYGGSYNGIVVNEANVYILGGTVQGSVFGGSYGNINISGNVPFPKANVTMTGGLVTKGVYGGSNSTGTVENVEMHINGGQVGTSSANANVHGGGYGEPTLVSGNVAVNLGTCGAASGATVYGDVYGGSAMGKVNTDNTNTTTVSLYKGTIYGGLYGGGYGPGGEDADVNGKVAVNVYGGSVLCSDDDPDGEAGTGSVFGCNNISGTPKSTVTVDIYGTDQPASSYALHAVYGGGNKAAYDGIPVVTVHGCNNSIDYVYGGGNATDVNGTDVTIWGGHIGNAFGGGNGFSETNNHSNASALHYNPGANITSDGTNLTIHGGTIEAAFGGSNQYGTINSTIAVTVKSETESGYDPCSGNAYTECEMNINELYGGGNEAPIQTSGGAWIEPTVTLDCSAKIGMLFGGAKAADYVGDIDLVVKGGTYDKVFGGNNKGGTITGNVKVTFKGGETNAVYGGCNENGTITGTLEVVIDKQTTDNCDLFYVGDVYGGGDMASYEAPDNHTDYPKVTIKNGTINGSVYGGGKGETATVTGNPEVVVGDVDVERYAIVRGNVYGGGNAAEINGHTFVLINNKAKVLSNIYGGGNMARVSGNTKVIVNGRID